jgi:hypothetical protein
VAKKMRTAAELEQALANAMINGPSYIGRNRKRCEAEHRDTLDRLTERLSQARNREGRGTVRGPEKELEWDSDEWPVQQESVWGDDV